MENLRQSNDRLFLTNFFLAFLFLLHLIGISGRILLCPNSWLTSGLPHTLSPSLVKAFEVLLNLIMFIYFDGHLQAFLNEFFSLFPDNEFLDFNWRSLSLLDFLLILDLPLAIRLNKLLVGWEHSGVCLIVNCGLIQAFVLGWFHAQRLLLVVLLTDSVRVTTSRIDVLLVVTDFFFDQMGKLIDFVHERSWLTSVGHGVWNHFGRSLCNLLHRWLWSILRLLVFLTVMGSSASCWCSSSSLFVWIVNAALRSSSLRSIFGAILSMIFLWTIKLILSLIEINDLGGIDHSNLLVPLR